MTTNGTTVNRTHDSQNEVTAVGTTSLAFDANGNTTTDEQGRTLIYDAWDRVVAVKNGSTTLVTFAYDALWHLVVQDAATAHHLYYSANWQVIEEQVSGNTVTQNVWSIVYIDALILRDRDTDSNGSLDERIWAVQDANFNVTALLSNSGSVAQRWIYTSYGVASSLTSAWSSTSDAYNWSVRFQGMFFDNSVGLGLQRHRIYSPELGRWMQADPLGFLAGDLDTFRYETNSPATLVDPTGLVPPLPQGFNPATATAANWQAFANSILPHPNPTTVQHFVDNNRAISAFYAEMHLANRELYLWAGNTAFVSHDIGVGMRNAALPAQLGMRMQVFGTRIGDLFAILAWGNTAIFRDVAWQHLAYHYGGLQALVNAGDAISPEALNAWRTIDSGNRLINSGNIVDGTRCIMAGNRDLLRYEQQRVLQPILDEFKGHIEGLTPGAMTGGTSIPGAGFVPAYGRFEVFAERWRWIDEVVLTAWHTYRLRHPDRVTAFLQQQIASARR